VRRYHNSFNPNCVCRGLLACDVITPNEPEVTEVFGDPNRASRPAPVHRTRGIRPELPARPNGISSPEEVPTPTCATYLALD
jgi:hypothetical protein